MVDESICTEGSQDDGLQDIERMGVQVDFMPHVPFGECC